MIWNAGSVTLSPNWIYIYIYLQYSICYYRIGKTPWWTICKAQYWQETSAIDIGTNKQCFAPNLLGLKLIKCNQRNWSHFKQTLKKSPHQSSARYTIDQFEKLLGWCSEATSDKREQNNKHLYKQWAVRSNWRCWAYFSLWDNTFTVCLCVVWLHSNNGLPS